MPPFRPIRIAASILSADFSRLGEEVHAVDVAGADWIHVDVMDGRFVPNITIGPLVARAVRSATAKVIDVHLMIVEPERYLEAFAQAGADSITAAAETCPHLHRTLQQIRALGKRAGVALDPHTPESVLVVRARPAGSRPGDEREPRLWRAGLHSSSTAEGTGGASHVDASGRAIELELDGGVRPGTAGRAVGAGADVLVLGSAIFGARDYAGAIAALRSDRAADDACPPAAEGPVCAVHAG